MTETERALAWCGNSVYHDECDQGVYDDRCGACRRMFERLSTHHLEAVGTLQTALRQLHRYSSDDMRIRHRQVVLLADLLALLPALEPTP